MLSKCVLFSAMILIGGIGLPADSLQSASGAPQAASKDQEASGHEDLDALLWLQTSAEFIAITRQTFRLAEMNLGSALVDPTWSACLEQQRMFAKQPGAMAALPPAVILDVDETVLDNSAYQARLIANGEEFDPKTWNLFVQEESGIAVPGAVDFIEACRAARVTVLYVTNREYEVEYATRRNLVKTGLLQENDPDVLLTKNERQQWTSDKKSRRTHLASQYRILMILGDDLNDFVSLGKKPTPEKRRKTATRYSDRWGRQWMALPNPNYGGWERSLYQWEDRAAREAKLKLKRSNLRD